MVAFERRQLLLDLLRKQPGMRVPELASALGVSEGTVRNDLNALEEDGHLKRFHGGAALAEHLNYYLSPFIERNRERSYEKSLIARYAAELVHDGDSILLDSSSTSYYLALAIQSRQHLSVVTNGIDVARCLAQNPTNAVILIGGILNQDGSSITGLFSEQMVHEYHIQKAFVSSSGFSIERGLTEVKLEEAQLRRKAMASAKEVIALIDSSKMGKESLTSFASLSQISRVYTDPGISPEWIQLITQAGVSLTICEPITNNGPFH